jgi:hypothetical protein
MDERTERISLRAYEIWERLGRPKGGHMEHWLEAEREIDAEMTGSPASDADAGEKKNPTAA